MAKKINPKATCRLFLCLTDLAIDVITFLSNTKLFAHSVISVLLTNFKMFESQILSLRL